MAEFDEQTKAALEGEPLPTNITENDRTSDYRLYTRNLRNLERRANTPSSIPGMLPANPPSPLKLDWRGIPTMDPKWMANLDNLDYDPVDDYRQAEAERLETEFYRLRGDQRLAWVAGQDPADLALLDNEVIEFIDSTVGFENAIITAQGNASLEERRIEDAVEQKIKSRARLRNAFGLIPGLGSVIQGITTDEMSMHEARQEVMEDMASPTSEAGWFMGLVGTVVGAAVDTASVPAGILTGHDENAERREAEAAILNDNQRIQAIRRDSMVQDIQSVFQQMETDDPETHQLLMEMGGFDPTKAMAVLGALMEQDIDAQDQIAQIEEDIEDHLIQMMRDEDYSMSRKLVEGLGAWDRYVPMRLATSAALLFLDEDVQAAVGSGKWEELTNAVEDSDYSVAKVLGLEKTGLGMAIDFASSIAFDPTTWLFGPKSAKGAMLRTPDDVARIVKSGVVKTTIDDIVEALAKGESSKAYTLASFLDDVDLADELLQLGQKTADDVGDVAGKGITKEMTEELRKIVDTPVTKSKGSDEGVGGSLKTQFQSMVDQFAAGNPDAPSFDLLRGPSGEELAPYEFGGSTYKAYFTREVDGSKGVFWVNEHDGIGAVIRTTDKGTGWYTSPHLRGKEHRMMTRTIEAMAESTSPGMGREFVADLLVRSANDSSITKAGANAVNREINNFLDNVLGGPGEAARAALDREAVEAIVKKGLLDGATLPSAQRLAVGVGVMNRLRTHLGSGASVKNLRRYMSPQRTVTNFNLRTPGGFRRIMQTTAEVWGENLDQANKWTNRFMELRRKKTAAKTAMLDDPLWRQRKALQEELELLDEQLLGDTSGALVDDLFEAPKNQLGPDDVDLRQPIDELEMTARETQNMIDDAADELGIEAGERGADDFVVGMTEDADGVFRQQAPVTPGKGLAARKAALEKQVDQLRAQLSAKYKGVDDYTDIHEALNEMWDEYNKEVIAKQKGWASKVDPKTGMVPWEHLRIGKSTTDNALTAEGKRAVFPDTEALKGANELFYTLSGVAGKLQGAHVPISPLDLVAAGAAGGARYRAWVAEGIGATARETFYAFHRAWVIDKVMRPSTALVVSFDELQRAFHIFGAEAMGKYMVAKMDRTAARAAAILRGRGISVSRGADSLPQSVQKRLKRQQEYPNLYRQAERQTYEGMGLGWDDIEPGMPGWEDAARRWHGQFLQDQGFRSFLEGEDSFRRWWNSTAADEVRINAGPGVTADDALAGWTQLWDYISDTAKKNGNLGDWTKAWKETAKEISENGGAPRELPDRILANTGTVRGTRKAAPHKFGLTNLQDKFFDNFFLSPTNYRRGFIHEMATEYETERLHQLFASQGREVLSDDALAARLGMEGSGAELRLVYGDYLDQLAEKFGGVSEGRIASIAEQRAIDEIDNIMYTWDTASRAGAATRGIFPFGGPWGDMMGFWGREMLTKPHLRGFINEGNFLGMRKLVRGAMQASPVNPRTAAFVSRMANTDTEVTRGWAGEGGGLLPGSDRSDISPLSFLPTSGDNPFGVLLPGIGFVPAFAADLLLTQVLSDPELEPAKYQALVDAVSEYIPTVGYSTGPLNQDLVGGGILGQSVGLIADGIGAATGASTYNVTNFLGDIGREINRTREVSAIMAQPGEIEDLLALTGDVDTLELALKEIAREADQQSAKSHAAQRGSRALLPVSSNFSNALDEVHDVWINAADLFPEELPATRVRAADLDMENEDDRRQFANDVRRDFFNLDQATRDRLITMNPQLAVNLVNSWEWTDRANELGHEAGTPYRTDGSRDALAEHQYRIENGYIRPVDPYKRTERILGLVIASQERTAKRVYEEAASAVNEVIWEGVNEESMSLLQDVVDDFGEELGMTEPRQVWEAWGQVEGEYETFLMEYAVANNIEIDEDKLKSNISLATDQKAWSTSYRGIDPEAVSSRFSKVTFNEIPEQVLPFAEAAGVELTPGMTGQELYQAITDRVTQVETPMYSFVMPAYDTYTQERGAAATSSTTSLRKQAFNTQYTEEWRNGIQEFMGHAEQVSEDVRNRNTPITRTEVDSVRLQFTTLMNGEPDALAWEEVWGNLYERTYGPLDWVEPTPPKLEDNPNVYRPYIRKVQDGDSLTVSEKETIGSIPPLGPETGRRKAKEVRLIGLRAADFGLDDEGAARDKAALLDAISNATTIQLVRDPANFGWTDRYGRELAWLFIDGEPFYNSDGFLPSD